ncbi:hypothetical protein G6F68_020373 [Rhizopus microsporus]|nr:hypothetical protein G6F68_020373 [Rhizopus microsporus]
MADVDIGAAAQCVQRRRFEGRLAAGLPRHGFAQSHRERIFYTVDVHDATALRRRVDRVGHGVCRAHAHLPKRKQQGAFQALDLIAG